MSRFFKTILLWILIAVVPLHAAAATIGMSCGPVHKAAMEPSSSDSTHQHHNMAAAADVADAHAASPDDLKSDKSPHVKCSACSAFCIGAVAPPSGFISVPAFSGAETLVVSTATLVIGFVPEGLKRPPRLIFA
ncbi:hypothetical protein [Massilia cavernae]|uniref:DUF2946 domain-containing protein n=1 Tax=Massilia cavernae TaxID=2320864 RepID=A0A418Y8U3_9BURK|nr:hypothetical protein [Massilia cavernae]RJG27911.1 hypothetical protein D3872_00260 [Massilia cavernae]